MALKTRQKLLKSYRLHEKLFKIKVQIFGEFFLFLEDVLLYWLLNWLSREKWRKYHKYFAIAKEFLYIGEPMRQQKNLVISGYRVEFD